MATRMAYQTVSMVDPSDQERVAALVALLGEGPCCAWLEDDQRVDGFRLRDDVPIADATGLIASWPEGRLFTDRADLRWERHPDERIHLTVIADDQLPAGVEGATELQACQGATHYLLWGTKQGEHWQEERIPFIDKWYPRHWKGPNAAIRVQAYEAPWSDASGGPAVREVTRYRSYDGDYTA